MLLDIVRLALVEQPADEADARVGGRGDADFAEIAAIAVDALDILVRADLVAGVVVKIDRRAEQRVVEIGIIRIVAVGQRLAAQMAAGDGEVPIADLALDRQRGLNPFVVAAFGVVLHRLQAARHRGRAFLRKAAVRFLDLSHQRRADRPVVVEFDPEREARAIGVDGVIILFDQVGVVLRDVVAGKVDHRIIFAVAIGVGVLADRIDARPRDIVDIAGVVTIPADEAQRRTVADPGVDEALGNAADAAARDAVEFEPHRAIGAAGVGLVGDELDRARHRARAVKRALRPRERLDAREVIGVNVERALDGRDRHFVEIRADGRQRGRMVGVFARCDAAEIDLAEPRRERLDRHRRQEFDDVLELLDLQLVEPLGPDRGDRERHVLQIFFALRRGDDDIAVVVGVGLLGQRGSRCAQDRAAEQERAAFGQYCR